MLLNSQLSWNEAIRAGLCMTPMLVGLFLGVNNWIVPLGQAGFFYSMMYLRPHRLGRFIETSIFIGIALGLYLLGANVVANIYLALLVTFLVGLNLALLAGWDITKFIAFSMVSVYAAGLNSSSPESAHNSLFAFLITFIWCGAISLLPFWKLTINNTIKPIPQRASLLNGLKLGFGLSVSLFLSNALSFSKMGWAPSAVGNVVRVDEVASRRNAKLRAIGTIAGAVVSVVILYFFTDMTSLVFVAFTFGVLHGLCKKSPLGFMPFFYTASIIILYSINAPGQSTEVAIQRVYYNIVGIVIGLLIVMYEFPIITIRLNKYLDRLEEEQAHQAK